MSPCLSLCVWVYVYALVQSRGTFLITFPFKLCIHSSLVSSVISIQCLFILWFLVTEGNVRELTFLCLL